MIHQNWTNPLSFREFFKAQIYNFCCKIFSRNISQIFEEI